MSGDWMRPVKRVQFLGIYLENRGGAAKRVKIVIETFLQRLLPAATHEKVISTRSFAVRLTGGNG